jgi:glutamine amidotransferase
VGAVTLENCHPFVRELWGRNWVFAHNGDLKGYAPPLHGSFRPVGNTDSELAFCWLLQELAKSHVGVPTVQELTRTLAELVPKIAKYGTFNFLMSNGQALWAHASTKLYYVLRQHPFTEVHLKDDDVTVDLASLNSPQDRLAIVVTEPLTTNEAWTAMAPGELQVFVDGAVAGCSCTLRMPWLSQPVTACSSASTNMAATSKPV